MNLKLDIGLDAPEPIDPYVTGVISIFHEILAEVSYKPGTAFEVRTGLYRRGNKPTFTIYVRLATFDADRWEDAKISIRYRSPASASVVFDPRCSYSRENNLTIEGPFGNPQVGDTIPADIVEMISSDDALGRALGKQQFLALLRRMITMIETHEVDEWLRFEEKHVTEPHPEQVPWAKEMKL